MPVGKIDIVNGSRVVERGGQILEIDRIAHVTGLDGNSRTLEQALNGTGFTGDAMPVPGAVHPDLTDLLLEDRVSAPIPGASGQARVTLTYKWNPTSLTIIGGGSGVESVVSERQGPLTTDPPIALVHPHNNKDTTSARNQGARINVTVARSSAVGIVSLATPEGESQAQRHVDNFNNKINSGQFLQAGDEKQWKVTFGDWEPVARVNTTGPTFGDVTRARFTFTFQRKLEMWNPVTVIANDRFGNPYQDISGNPTARADILWFQEVAFSGISSITP